jgi:hypothetical protein
LLTLTATDAISQVVAVVEDASADLPYQQFDFLERNTKIDLGESGYITLGYLNSCTYEEIRGGTVFIDAFQSNIFGGAGIREEVNCDGGGLVLDPNQSAQSGADVFRDVEVNEIQQIVVFGGPPIFISKEIIGKITLEDESTSDRLDLDHNRRVLDLKKNNFFLTDGSSYRITYKGSSFKVEIHFPEISSTKSPPLISRLVRLP